MEPIEDAACVPQGPPQLELAPDLPPLEWEGLAVMTTRGGGEFYLNLYADDQIRPGEGFPSERYIGRGEDGAYITDQGVYSTLRGWQRFAGDDASCPAEDLAPELPFDDLEPS